MSSCPLQCIELVKDKEGFMYPQVDTARCIDCGKCEKACPELVEAKGSGGVTVYAAVNPDKEARLASSSGGIFHSSGRIGSRGEWCSVWRTV